MHNATESERTRFAVETKLTHYLKSSRVDVSCYIVIFTIIL